MTSTSYPALLPVLLVHPSRKIAPGHRIAVRFEKTTIADEGDVDRRRMLHDMLRTDKSVYDIRAKRRQDDRWLVLAMSADATLADLHLALLGAFEWSGSYSDLERLYCFSIGGHVFRNGKGSRTTLRKLLSDVTEFAYMCDPAAMSANCGVVNRYQVPSRRHYPKVIDAHPDIWTQGATWHAQIAARREYREYESNKQRAANPAFP